MPNVTLDIPQDVLESAQLSTEELKIELALTLYAQHRLSVGKARELGGLSLWQFRQLIAERGIPPHIDETTLAQDIETLNALDRQ